MNRGGSGGRRGSRGRSPAPPGQWVIRQNIESPVVILNCRLVFLIPKMFVLLFVFFSFS